MKHWFLFLPILLYLPTVQDGCEDDNPAVNVTLSSSQIDQVVLEEMARQNVTGMVVGVVQNGEIEHLAAYGHDDLERTQPLNVEDKFIWASISKPLTSIATFKAINEGHMSLDDRASQHVSNWPSSGQKGNITIRHLLTNRSGIVHHGRDHNDDYICNPRYGRYNANNNFNAEECVEVFNNCDLGSNPGQLYNYTTFGFNLVGAAIEGATGIPYEDYILDMVSAVPEMESLDPYYDGRGGFKMDCNRSLYADEVGKQEDRLPGGGWASDIEGMAGFMKGLINNSFTSSVQMWLQQVNGNGTYRYGINAEQIDGEFFVHHSGNNAESKSFMGFFPMHGNGVCYMTNASSYLESQELARRILNLMGYSLDIKETPMDLPHPCKGTSNCGNQVAALWRDNNASDSIVMRRGLNSTQFTKEIDFLEDAGYQLVDVETYQEGVNRKWDGIFRKSDLDTRLFQNLSTSALNNQIVTMRSQGKTLVDVETYLNGANRRWTALFQEGIYDQGFWYDFSRGNMEDKVDEMNAGNIKLIDIETYKDGLVRHWAGVFRGPGTATFVNNKNKTTFLQDNQVTPSTALIDIETYMNGANRRWAGVYENSNQGDNLVVDENMCPLLREFHEDLKADGKELLDLEKY